MLDELPERDPVRAAIDRAWRLPAKSLSERAARAQRAGLALGLRELDGPARALVFLSDQGDALERAELAVELAPSLPAAHAALARAKLERGDVASAWRAFDAGLRAIPLHLEARAWWAATSAAVATHWAFAFALWVALLGAVAALPALIYGLGATRLGLSGPAALAALGAFVMALALLEGPAGAVLGLAALAVASGGLVKRTGVLVAMLVALAALHFGIERGAAGRLMLAAEPVAVAVHRIEAGLPTPTDLGVALRAARSDAAAGAAIALHTKRAGDREAAGQYFERVLARGPAARAYNNAANVAFARGDVTRAIALYSEATEREQSAIALYNLSQAYGRAIRLDDQDRALATAQGLDATFVERMTRGNGIGADAFVADMNLLPADIAQRVKKSGLPAELGAIERERFAPGRLGRDPRVAAVLCLLVLGLACGAGLALERAAGPRDFYADLARTLRSAAADSAQRVAQLTRLRSQRARTERLLTVVSLVVPGAAGFRFGRPLAALVASAACSGALAIGLGLRAAPPDPLAVGALPALLAQFLLAACAVLYGLATATAVVLRVEE
jgi:tetratricopeptide (TPR) repeat protein